MNDILWVEKYRPKLVDQCVLPDNTQKVFTEIVKKGEIPNLLLTGSPGIGKTTIAKALCNQLECDWLMINGSDEGRMIDTLRTTINNFASTVSLSGGKKVLIIDEADYIIFCVTEPFRLATRYKLPITVEWHGLTTLEPEEFESTRSPGPGLDANTRIESIKKMQSISRAVNDYYNILMDYDYHTVVQRGLLREIDALIKEKEKKCIFFSCFSESFCDYTFESGGWGNKNLYDLGVNGSDVDALNHMDEKTNYNMFRVVRDIINDGNFNPREINMDKYFSKNQKHAWGIPMYFRIIRDRF